MPRQVEKGFYILILEVLEAYDALTPEEKEEVLKALITVQSDEDTGEDMHPWDRMFNLGPLFNPKSDSHK